MEKGFVRKLWKFPVETQRAALKASGLTDAAIYEANGNRGEDVDAILKAFRGQGGTLKIAADMRVFGDNQMQITEAVDKLETARVRIVDLAHPDLKTISAQQRWAFARLVDWSRWQGDKKRARRTGAAGGKAKGLVAAAKRAEKIPDAAVRELLSMIGEKLTWRKVSKITGISMASLRRHYKD